MTKETQQTKKPAQRKKGARLFLEILWRDFWELIKLNLLFILTCIPIITIPPAFTSMTRITLCMVRGENYFLGHEYFRCFKREFFRSLAAGAVLLAGTAMASLSVWFYFSMAAERGSLFLLPAGIGLVLLLLLVIMSFYVFPMLALVDLKLSALFKNALLLCFGCMKRNLLILLLLGGLLGICLLSYPGSSLFGILILFSLLNLIATILIHESLKEYVICVEGEPKQVP